MNTQELDNQARKLGANYLQTEGELLVVLMEMKRQGAFSELGFTGIFEYCERALKFSRAQCFYFKSVAEKSEVIPEIKDAILQGELTLSQARRIVPVVNQENSKHWIDQAKNLSQVELEKMISEHNPNAHPVKERIKPVAKDTSELRISVDKETEENLKALQDILSQKLSRAASLTETMAWMSRVCREKFDPIEKAKRAISSRKQNEPKPGRRPIPQDVKHEVVTRDKNQCTYVSREGRRCSQKRWLHFHHEKEVRMGGLNTASNLKLLCSTHHRMLHPKHDGPGHLTHMLPIPISRDVVKPAKTFEEVKK